MNKTYISIATITLARDEEEETLLRSSLQELSELEIPVFITDGGSSAGFLDFLQSFPHFTLSKAKVRGVCEQAKNSLSEAFHHGSTFIFYTEPDKLDFFRKSSDFIKGVEVNEKSGIVMASRSATAFGTFPAFQQMTETTINNCCNEIIGNYFDYTYGPFLLNRKLVPYLKLIKEDIGWGWRPFTFSIANRLGYRVETYAGDFCCPLEQREDTPAERIYRMRQLEQNIRGIVLATNVTLNEH